MVPHPADRSSSHSIYLVSLDFVKSTINTNSHRYKDFSEIQGLNEEGGGGGHHPSSRVSPLGRALIF